VPDTEQIVEKCADDDENKQIINEASKTEFDRVDQIVIKVFSFISPEENFNTDQNDKMWALHSGFFVPIVGAIALLFGSYTVYLAAEAPLEWSGIIVPLLLSGSMAATGAPIGTLIKNNQTSDVAINTEMQRFCGFVLISIGFMIQLLAPLILYLGVEPPQPGLLVFVILGTICFVSIRLESMYLEKWD